MAEILLVDDDQYILQLVKSLLVQEGMSVQCVTSGEEALCKLKENAFDLMITDLNMPEMDGLVLTRRAIVIAPDTPVIMITGSISQGIPIQAKESGITAVLAKPFSSEALLKTISGVVGRQRRSADSL